jgi:RNA polymerase sigma-70 factor (sigma-E family)
VNVDVTGEEAAFAVLFADKAPRLRRVAYLLCSDWHQADDLVQTTFVKLYGARLRDAAATDAWLRTTLTRVWLDERRRPWRRERPTDQLPEVAVMDPGPEVHDALLQALDRVPPRQRACLVLRYFEDLDVEVTATALGCSTGTVKSNTARGLTALRHVIDADRTSERTSP